MADHDRKPVNLEPESWIGTGTRLNKLALYKGIQGKYGNITH